MMISSGSLIEEEENKQISLKKRKNNCGRKYLPPA
jgi:hypothetical protein